MTANIWDQILGRIESKVNRHSFLTWFKPTAFVEAKRALAENRYATIEAAARAVAEKAIEISNEFSPPSPFERR